MKAVQIKKSITNNEREMETKPEVKYIYETINEKTTDDISFNNI